MSDMSELEGTAAIVTGASRGIGLAIARGLMQAGSRVCITARHAEGVDEALEILKPYGEAIGVVGKVDSEEHQTEVIESTIRNFGRIDFVVNNATIGEQEKQTLRIDLYTLRDVRDGWR